MESNIKMWALEQAIALATVRFGASSTNADGATTWIHAIYNKIIELAEDASSTE